MRTLSRLIAAAGIVGAIAATGGAAAMAQGVYLQGPGFGVDIGRPAYRERHYYGATPIMTARAFTQGDITEGLTRTSVAGVTATGISDYGYTASVTLPWSKRAKKSARLFFAPTKARYIRSVPPPSVATFSAALGDRRIAVMRVTRIVWQSDLLPDFLDQR